MQNQDHLNKSQAHVHHKIIFKFKQYKRFPIDVKLHFPPKKDVKLQVMEDFNSIVQKIEKLQCGY
jgi:hypothetical protein